MKRLMLLLAFLISIGTSAFGQEEPVVTTLVLQESGTLLDLLTDEQIEQSQKIVISGNSLSSKDFAVLKTMIIQHRLTDVDIEETTTTAITERAFEGCANLLSIKLPKYLISTGWYSFEGCSGLTGIQLPNPVTDIANSFRGCSSLTSIILGRNVKNIDSQSFMNCHSLMEVHCRGSVPPACELSSFSNLYSQCTLYVPEGYKRTYAFADGWLNFENIQEEYVEPPYKLQVKLNGGTEAWRVCPSYEGAGGNILAWIHPSEECEIEVDNGEEVVIEILEQTTSINDWKIESIILNDEDITSQLKAYNRVFLTISQDSKLEINMKDLNVPTEEKHVDVVLESAGSLGSKLVGTPLSLITSLSVSGYMNASDFEIIRQMEWLIKVDLSRASIEDKQLPASAFGGLRNLQEIVLPDEIEVIGYKAFGSHEEFTSALKKVNLPISLERIESEAFYCCQAMEEVSLSSLSNLTYIGPNAFYNCSAIPESLSLPNSIEYIGGSAFSQTKVTSIDFSNTSIREIGNGAFYSCVITGSLNFPSTLIQIGSNAFYKAAISIIKLRSSSMVQLEGTDVFGSVDKETCRVYVPKDLVATYKHDNFWSQFANNIVEFGYLVTATTNNSAYGTVSGGGAYEEGETVTLRAKCGDAQWNGWSKYVNLFAGWYEGDNKVSDELTYQPTINTDKDYLANFERINFEWDFRADAPDVFARMENVQSTTNSVTVNVIEDSPEVIMFAGWYENGRLISADRQITIMTNGNNDSRTIKALMVNAHSNVDGLINDDDKVDGQNVRVWYFAKLTIQGDNTWKPNEFMVDRNASMLVESPVEPKSVNMYWERYSSNWQFISFPYNLKVSDIQMDGYQFVVREYDGDARASKGMGESWKQLSASDVMQANKGYILRSNGTPSSSSETYNSSIDDMNKLFNRQAVTIPLEKHASNVPADANWNLVGNPFPCYFSVEQLFDAGLNGTVTVWSDDIQNYEYYTQDDKGAYLAPLTAFFIQHNQTASVTFNPEGRAATLPTTRAAVADLRSDAGREVINLLLANDSLSDKTRVVFNEAASTDYELGKDAAKFSSMNNNAPSLYTLDAQNQQLAINERPVGNGVVRLGCYIGVKGSYTLSAKEALASDLYLYDTETGASCNLRETSYTFTAEAGACNNRFELRTSLKGTGIAAIEGFSWQVAGDQLLLNGLPTGATVSLFDANGRMLFTGDAATATQGMAFPQSGIYYLTIRTAEGVSSTVSIKR